jgi:hypothetical protein
MIELKNPTLRGKKVGEVYETYNYDQFIFTEGNRTPGTKLSHVKELESSMLRTGRNIVPIIVSRKTSALVDGEHRKLIAKKHNLPLRYIYDDQTQDIASIQEIQIGRKWNNEEYANCYTTPGSLYNESYKFYKDFMVFSGFGHNMTLAFLKERYSNKVKDINQEFKAGTLEVTESQFEKAVKMAKKILDLEEYHGKRIRRRCFVLAILTFILNVKRFDHDRLVYVVMTKRGDLLDHTTTEGYFRNLCKLYNYRLSEKEKIDPRKIDIISAD